MPDSSEKKSSEGVKRQPPVLDTSGAGGPYIPHEQINSQPPGPPESDLIVEVELAAGTTDLREELTTNTAGFMAEVTNESTASGSSFAAVLQSYGLLEARPVFTREQVTRDEESRGPVSHEEGVTSNWSRRASGLSSLSSFVRLRFPRGTPAKEVINSLKKLPEVIRVAAVPRSAPPLGPADNSVTTMTVLTGPIPNDHLIGADGSSIAADAKGFERQWYLHRTRAPQAWAFARGAGVVIADIDWGFLTAHQDLEPGIELTYNAVDDTTHVTDGPERGHGTAVLGIAGARADGDGVAGYAPESDLWAIQADSAVNPSVFSEPWAEAIHFVRRRDAGTRRKVIILENQTEFGGNYEQIPTINDAIRDAIAHRCIVCVAAGNGNRPAHLTDNGDDFKPTGSILVGATSYHPDKNERAGFSNYGKSVIVSAPGDKLHDLTCGIKSISAYRNGFGGTSGATPKVAGTIALMLSVNSNLSNDEIREILTTTGSPIATNDPEKQIGVFLNTEAAVAEVIRRRDESSDH